MDISEELTSLCAFCKQARSRYTCPRCHFSYCSVNCYKHPQHTPCSERFYQECVVNHLNQSKTSESKTRMMEILNRGREAEDIDSCDEDHLPDLAERLEGVNLGDSDQVWEKLTEEERSDFRRFYNEEEIKFLLPEWKPWWHYKKAESLVEEVENVSSKSTILPPIWSDIPHLHELIKRKPSSFLKYSLINCIYGYVYLVKFYNGDYATFPLDFILTIIKISNSLENSPQIWNDCDSAITSVKQAIQQNMEFSNTNSVLVEVVNELKLIIEGSNSKCSTDDVLRVLTDIKILLTSAKQELESTKSCASSKDVGKKLGLVERKILFYLSWVLDFGAVELPNLNLELNIIYELNKIELNKFEEQKKLIASVDELKQHKWETGSLKVEEIS